jgi:hypothetical protein
LFFGRFLVRWLLHRKTYPCLRFVSKLIPDRGPAIVHGFALFGFRNKIRAVVSKLGSRVRIVPGDGWYEALRKANFDKTDASAGSAQTRSWCEQRQPSREGLSSEGLSRQDVPCRRKEVRREEARTTLRRGLARHPRICWPSFADRLVSGLVWELPVLGGGVVGGRGLGCAAGMVQMGTLIHSSFTG